MISKFLLALCRVQGIATCVRLCLLAKLLIKFLIIQQKVRELVWSEERSMKSYITRHNKGRVNWVLQARLESEERERERTPNKVGKPREKNSLW